MPKQGNQPEMRRRTLHCGPSTESIGHRQPHLLFWAFLFFLFLSHKPEIWFLPSLSRAHASLGDEMRSISTAQTPAVA